MVVLRKNTLVVDFSVLPKRPNAEKVQEFLEKNIKLKLADVKNIQFHNIRNCVYIETIDSETALRYEKANCNKHAIVCNNMAFKIPVYVESEAVTVRVHDLPSHTHHSTVINFMQQYGVVISITRERWKHYFPGVYNGVRVLRMHLSHPIPSIVTINDEKTLVTYRNQPKTCNQCGGTPHPKQKCAQISRTPNNNNKAAPKELSGQHLNEDEFPRLPVAPIPNKSSLKLGSALSMTREVTDNQKDENNAIGVSGDNCDDNDDDDDDDDDEDEEDDNDDRNLDRNDSSDSNDFIEAVSQKRRLSKRLEGKHASEQKKVCVSQSNRFQALVGIDSVRPSAVDIDDYMNRSNARNKKCNASS